MSHGHGPDCSHVHGHFLGLSLWLVQQQHLSLAAKPPLGTSFPPLASLALVAAFLPGRVAAKLFQVLLCHKLPGYLLLKGQNPVGTGETCVCPVLRYVSLQALLQQDLGLKSVEGGFLAFLKPRRMGPHVGRCRKASPESSPLSSTGLSFFLTYLYLRIPPSFSQRPGLSTDSSRYKYLQ